MKQPRLPGTSTRRRQGTVERNVVADLRRLREAEAIAPGMSAVESALKRVAAELDAAYTEHDRYGVINTARELLRLRTALTPGPIHEGDDSLERFIAQLPSTPRGNVTEPGAA